MRRVSKKGKIRRGILESIIIFICLCILIKINTEPFKKTVTESSDLTLALEEKEAEQTENQDGYFSKFSLPMYGGGTFTEKNLKDYRLTVLNAWAPWCVSCVDEMPELDELAEELKAEKIQIVGIVADYEEMLDIFPDYYEQIQAVMDGLKISYPCLLADSDFIEKVKPEMNNAFPGTWLLTSEGEVLKFISGAKSKEEWLEIIHTATDKQ